MPLGFERLNERTQRPNSHINFIRTLSGQTSSTAESILNRVAAVCYPFMKKHMILVQALEEFPYNNEFVGRNFNAGEVIQLVLRNRQGQWLPEKWVVMVMVHELAHCKQMNHSKAFWKVRDEYAKDLKELWAKGYSGEGLWGRGRSLEDGHIHNGSVAAGDVPEHLCGGTYGRRKKRRKGGKAKQELSYAEKKQRRILRKFGAGGQALGSDDDTKVKLEGGVAKKGKPRVAGSARGRDLRAAAALARFETIKKEDPMIKQEEVESNSGSEDEYEDASSEGAALDVDGKKMVDDRGRALIKICEDEDDRDGNARREMEEIQDIESDLGNLSVPSRGSQSDLDGKLRSHKNNQNTKDQNSVARSTNIKKPKSSARVLHLDEIYKRGPDPTTSKPARDDSQDTPKAQTECTVCSLVNEQGSITCAACANVLDPRFVPHHWKCPSATCKNSKYINSGDAGVCGVCGTSRPIP